MRNSVSLTAFGEGRFEFFPVAATATIGDVLEAHGIEPNGRRIAHNGNPAELGTGVLEGDQVSVVRRVEGG